MLTAKSPPDAPPFSEERVSLREVAAVPGYQAGWLDQYRDRWDYLTTEPPTG